MHSADLKYIFRVLLPLLARHSPPFVVTIDVDSRYELWSRKDVIIAGRKRKEVFFSSLIIQRGYVGFYFMPVYVDVEVKKLLKRELLTLLKGKSCFHITTLNRTLVTQIRQALKIGMTLYRKHGWV